MTERVELGSCPAEYAPVVTEPQVQEKHLQNSWEYKKHASRFLKAAAPLLFITLAAACREARNQETPTSTPESQPTAEEGVVTGLLGAQGDCTLITDPKIYYEDCPPRYILADENEKQFSLKGDVLSQLTDQELKKMSGKTDEELAKLDAEQRANLINKLLVDKFNGRLITIRGQQTGDQFQVESYEILGPYSIMDFREDVNEYIPRELDCLDPESENALTPDKPLGERNTEDGWEFQQDRSPRFFLRATDSRNPASIYSITLSYDANGNFLPIETAPNDLKVCPQQPENRGN